jgi:hypothetical protein
LAEEGGERCLVHLARGHRKGRWWIAPRPLAWPSIGTL